MKSLRSKGWISWTLISIGVVLTFVALLATWASKQALDTKVWVKTSSALLQDPAVQAATASYLSQQLVASPATTERVRQALPDNLDKLAGPLTGLLGQASERLALQAMKSGAFQDVWTKANRLAHTQLVAIIENRNGEIRRKLPANLDLRPMLGKLALRLGVSPQAIAKAEAKAGVIRVIGANDIRTVQKAGNTLKSVQWISLVLALLFLAGGVIFAADRRRAVVKVGGGLIIVGLLVLAARRIGGKELITAVSSNGAGTAAAEAVWEIGTSLLKGGAWALLILGFVMLLGSWMVGPGERAKSVRKFLTPTLIKYPVVPVAVVLILVLVLLSGGLLPFATRPLPVLIYLGGSVLFVLGLRRQMLIEPPPRDPATT